MWFILECGRQSTERRYSIGNAVAAARDGAGTRVSPGDGGRLRGRLGAAALPRRSAG